MDKWNGKYRIPSARASWWDYANEGAYFITICTHLRQHFLGKCAQQKMVLSLEGILAQGLWHEIPRQFPNIDLGEFIVMPNHIHGVLIQNAPELPTNAGIPTTKSPTTNVGGVTGLKNPMLSENISKVVRWYKGRCSYEIHKIQKNFEWQERFWENIILNDASFHRISNYIIQNPQNWEADSFFDP